MKKGTPYWTKLVPMDKATFDKVNDVSAIIDALGIASIELDHSADDDGNDGKLHLITFDKRIGEHLGFRATEIMSD